MQLTHENLYTMWDYFIVLPYLGTISSNLKWKLRTCFTKSLPECNIKIILNSTNHFSSLFHFEFVIPKELQSHIVQKFSCDNFNVTYCGKTERHLNERLSEHIGMSHLTGKEVEFKPFEFQITFYCMAAILTTSLCWDNNDFRLLLKEPILISRDSPVLSKNTASIPLLLFD